MSQKLIFKGSKVLHAPAQRIWQALTDPAQIKQWLFGTNTVTDWKKGSPITYNGEWQGKPYQDKGIIIDIVPGKLLHTTYFSFMSGKEDKPENYANVIYELQPEYDGTKLTISQDNIDSEAQLQHMQQNWGMVMDGIKKVVES